MVTETGAGACLLSDLHSNLYRGERCPECGFDNEATPPAPVSETGEGVAGLLAELAVYLPSIRVFLTSREKAHKAGVQWHDELCAKIEAIRSATNAG